MLTLVLTYAACLRALDAHAGVCATSFWVRQRVKWEAKGGFRFPWAKPASSFIAFQDGFHGRTLGALALTWKARRNRARFACCALWC